MNFFKKTNLACLLIFGLQFTFIESASNKSSLYYDDFQADNDDELLAVDDVNNVYSIDVNKRYDNGKTPLHKAVRLKAYDPAQSLISSGANLNIRDDQGKTVLHYATEQKDYEFMKMFINAGIDTSIPDNYGKRALQDDSMMRFWANALILKNSPKNSAAWLSNTFFKPKPVAQNQLNFFKKNVKIFVIVSLLFFTIASVGAIAFHTKFKKQS